MKTEHKLAAALFQLLIIGLFSSCVSTGKYHYADNNLLEHTDFAGENITVQIHKVFGHWYHASIKITLDSDEIIEKYGIDERNIYTDTNGIKYMTLGAGPNNLLFNRRLKAEFNRPRDINERIKVETYDFISTEGDIVEKIEKILDAFKAYSNALRYSFFPEKSKNKFNSNSFISGLLYSAGLEAPKFSNKYKMPGYNRPVPLP